MTIFSHKQQNNDLSQCFIILFIHLFHKKLFFEMILSIGETNYSYRYRLQPIILIIGPITRTAVISVQLMMIIINDGIE